MKNALQILTATQTMTSLEEICLRLRDNINERELKELHSCFDDFEKIKHDLPKGIQTMFYFFWGDCAKNQIELREKNGVETYLVVNATTGFHKIGRTTQGVEKRMSQFAAMSAGNCYVVGTAPKDIENDLHRQFSAKRIKGEWFSLSKDDVNEILELFSVVNRDMAA